MGHRVLKTHVSSWKLLLRRIPIQYFFFSTRTADLSHLAVQVVVQAAESAADCCSDTERPSNWRGNSKLLPSVGLSCMTPWLWLYCRIGLASASQIRRYWATCVCHPWSPLSLQVLDAGEPNYQGLWDLNFRRDYPYLFNYCCNIIKLWWRYNSPTKYKYKQGF